MTAIKPKIRSCFLEHTAPTDKVTETAADTSHKYVRLSRRDFCRVCAVRLNVTATVTLLLFVLI